MFPMKIALLGTVLWYGNGKSHIILPHLNWSLTNLTDLSQVVNIILTIIFTNQNVSYQCSLNMNGQLFIPDIIMYYYQ